MRIVAASLCLLSLAAFAQCRADVDCKGDRICINGSCQSPSGAARVEPPPPPPPPPVSGEQPPPPPPLESLPANDGAPSAATGPRELPGWAMGGVVLGFTSAAAIAGLAAVSAATTGGDSPGISEGLGAVATLVLAISVPLVVAAGSSVRGPTGVSGVGGLRVTGWIFYGVTLALAVGALVWGLVDAVPGLYIAGLGASGVVSEVMVTLDTLFSRSEASFAVSGSAQGPRVFPAFAVVPRRGLPAAPALLLAGTF